MNLPSHKKYSPPAKLKMIALCAFIASTNAAAYTINPGDTVTVDGLGGGTQTSPWVLGAYESFTVNGTMEVRNAGVAQAPNGNGYIADGSGNIGYVTVSGPGSAWEIYHNAVGYRGGTGYLTIENGGKVTNTFFNIGSAGASTGYVVVTGQNSKLTSSNNFLVGSSGGGTGYMTVSDGGVVSTATDGYIAYSLSSTGAVQITGQGSQWNIGQKLDIGESGTGSLTISDGGIVTVWTTATISSVAGGTGILNIGAAEGDSAVAAGQITANSIVFGPGNSTLVFNHTDSGYTFNTAITSAFYNTNSTVKVLSGQTILTGTNTYVGQTLISGGMLQAGGLNTLSPYTDYTTSANGTLNLDGYAHTLKSLVNGGIVRTGTSTSAMSVGTTLTVNGNYTGNSGALHLRTALGDDTSLTDQFVVRGNATGTTYVSVSNAGGLGDETDYGIKIIDVAGTSAANAFVQSGRIVGGAYEYSLIRGDAYGGDTESWYLTSKYMAPGSTETQLRPETGAYLANLSAANSMFNLTLHDRLGELQYTDLLTGQTKVSSMWIRHNYGESKSKDTTGQITTKSDRNVIQIGGDIAQWSGNGQNRFHVGVMGGYGSVDSHSRSSLTAYSSKAQIDGYSLGAYATWFANQKDYSGLYIDGWAMWSDLNANVTGSSLQGQNYNIKGVTASLEAGYSFNVWAREGGYSAWLQPQAQVTWMNAKADNHYEEDTGTYVKGNHGNVQTRLGVRGYVNNAGVQTSDNKMIIQPYMELNWLHNTKRYRVDMSDAQIWQDGAKNLAEVKVGLEANINKTTSLWFNIAHQFGSHSYRDTGALIGARFSF